MKTLLYVLAGIAALCVAILAGLAVSEYSKRTAIENGKRTEKAREARWKNNGQAKEPGPEQETETERKEGEQ